MYKADRNHSSVVLNFRLNLEAFVLILRQESPVDVEQDTQSWVGITRYTLYITQAVIADGILVELSYSMFFTSRG